MNATGKSLNRTAADASRAVCCATVAALLLAGCATEPAPVEDRSLGGAVESAAAASPARGPAAGYRVVRGDTLYSIAFKRGLDYRDVAAWNGIAPPYKILVDQELRLTQPGAGAGTRAIAATRPAAPAPPASALPPAPPTVAPSGGATTTAVAAAPPSKASMFEDVPASQFAPPPSAPVDTATAASPSASAAAALPPPQMRGAAESAAPAGAPSKPIAASASAPEPLVTAPALAKPVIEAGPPPKPGNDAASANVSGIAWHWPGSGRLVGSFVGGDQTKQGIDIAGAAGDPIRAAADGEVVYSGNGLIGYGELIIVKHNASFLSAYGHNRKRLVAEGDKVRAGQQIAEMGSSGAARDALHFEIRKNGKPVNPVEYLPAR